MAAPGAAALPHVPQRPVHLLGRAAAEGHHMHLLNPSKQISWQGLGHGETA